MDVYAGEAASLIAPFLVDGEFVSPSSASYTLRANDGSVILADQDLGSPLNTQVVVAIDASHNTVGAGLEFEYRYVDVKFVAAGKTYRARETYRVRPFINATASEADVRSALGVFDHELPDADIDLYEAYLRVSARVGSDKLAVALAAGNLTTVNANRAIAYMAALEAMSSLQMRVSQATLDDTQQFERLAKLDLGQLLEDVRNTFELYVTQIDPTFTPVDQTILAIATPTDPITGA